MIRVVLAALLVMSSWCVAEPATVPSERLQKIVTDAAHKAMEKFSKDKLEEKDFSITVIDLRDAEHPQTADFRGDTPTYPASVVKLFYLAYANQLIADKKLADTPELRRGLKEMIVNSDNDATAYILYAITDAPNGAELPEKEMAEWSFKRNAVNRYFQSLGYPKINACQCAYSFGPFGRERIFLGEKLNNRNSVSTNATARCLADIVRGHMVSPEHSKQMMELLHRDMTSKSGGNDDQAHGFTALALDPAKDQLYSKAGWTNTSRHDAAYIETPDGQKVVITTFTTGHARQRDIIPSIAKSVLSELRASAQP